MQNPRAEGRHVSLYTVTLDNVPPLFPQCPSPSLLDLPSCHLLVTNIHCVDVTAGTFQICESRFTLRINVVTLADARQKRLTSSVTICVVPLSNGQKFTCLPAHLFPADAKDRAAVKARQGRGAQVLDYNVEHNHHSPGRLELILPIMLDWETVFVNSAFRN